MNDGKVDERINGAIYNFIEWLASHVSAMDIEFLVKAGGNNGHYERFWKQWLSRNLLKLCETCYSLGFNSSEGVKLHKGLGNLQRLLELRYYVSVKDEHWMLCDYSGKYVHSAYGYEEFCLQLADLDEDDFSQIKLEIAAFYHINKKEV